MQYLAKSKPEENVEEHTGMLVQCLEQFFRVYGEHFTEIEKALLRIACRTHDLGKIHPIFQEIVRGNRRNRDEYMPHGFFSGMFLNLAELKDEFSSEEIRALVTAIHYHHTRPDDYTEGRYHEQGEQYMRSAYEDFTGKPYPPTPFRYLRYRLFINSSSFPLTCPAPSAWQKYALLKGLLNKMDYAASEHIPLEEIEIAPQGSLVTTILDKFGNQLRPAQRFMQEHRDDNIIVIAPTGSGKTEGALLWLGDHKGFYTLPMKVSANAIFERIHGTYDFKTAGLLHSDSVYEYLCRTNVDRKESQKDPLAEYKVVKSLAMPLTVSTVDQLFKFVFKALGTEIFAATLKYSRVIIDEMQMYSPAIVAMLQCGLKTISEMGGKFAIITATLPPFLQRILRKDLKIEFASDEFPSDDLRHFVHLQLGDFDPTAILEAGQTKKALVLCNTVVTAQKMLAQLPGARLLHSRFIKRDRAILEAEIQKFAKGDAPGIWISTQLVEASLDIDFDELHTEMCVADSLLQRMGRCFRSRTYEGTTPNVFVYDNGTSKIYDDLIYARSLNFLRKYTGRIFTEKEKLAYIEEVYEEESIKETKYYKTIQRYLKEFENLPPLKYDKDEADERFRDIRNLTVIPREIYEANRTEINAAAARFQQRGLSRADRMEARQSLEQYTTSIGLFSNDKDFVERHPLKDTDIWITGAKYDFEPVTHIGGGLLRENDNFL